MNSDPLKNCDRTNRTNIYTVRSKNVIICREYLMTGLFSTEWVISLINSYNYVAVSMRCITKENSANIKPYFIIKMCTTLNTNSSLGLYLKRTFHVAQSTLVSFIHNSWNHHTLFHSHNRVILLGQFNVTRWMFLFTFERIISSKNVDANFYIVNLWCTNCITSAWTHYCQRVAIIMVLNKSLWWWWLVIVDCL